MNQRCFVIQGFGKKQDYEQGKMFDLDASYEVIKEAVEDEGLQCFRADELSRNGCIEKTMYEELLGADLVIADITTLNFNAGFELGVRFALRPYATLIVGEKGMNFPFDINHVYIHSYEHLGPDIGRREARRFQKMLKTKIKDALKSKDTDSPVYLFLNQLPQSGLLNSAYQINLKLQAPDKEKTLRDLTGMAIEAVKEGRFIDAIELWEKARKRSGKNDYILQQLALATYKSKNPDELSALYKAKEILSIMQPYRSFDTETLGLWAAVHKRLYELNPSDEFINEAIFALEKGFFIKHDYYNGINLAFMLDIKAAKSNEPEDCKDDLMAFARHVRRKVKGICLKAFEDPEMDKEEKYWLFSTMYEACVGLGEQEDAEKWKHECEKIAVAEWMIDSTNEQIEKLRDLLKYNLQEMV